MAAFGTGVNPALGRIDYTPYLQGSLQGSAALGRGIASLGEGAAQAIKEYTQNKETRDLITQNNENQAQKAMAIAQAFQNNPQLFGGVSPISEKTFTDLKNMPSMSMGKLKALNAELNASITKYEPVLQKFAESENIRMRLNIANQLTGTGIDPLAAALQAGLGADQATSFATGISQRNLAASEIAKNAAAAMPRTVSPLEQEKIKAEIDKLNAETAKIIADSKSSGAQEPFKKGERRILTVYNENKQPIGSVDAIWDGSKWQEFTSGAPVFNPTDIFGQPVTPTVPPTIPMTGSNIQTANKGGLPAGWGVKK